MKGFFVSNLKSEWISDDLLKVLETFTFVDERKVKWTTPADYVTDGASLGFLKNIPGVGHPFSGDFIESAVIHDFYCERKLRSQKDTHRAFREALKADGVSYWRRWTMWLAVRGWNRVKNPDWA